MESFSFEIDVGVHQITGHQITGHKVHSTFFSNIILPKKNGEVHFQCRVAEVAFYFEAAMVSQFPFLLQI